MVDHKAGRKIVVRIGNEEFTLPESGANGHFSTVIQLSDAQVEKLRNLSAGLASRLPAKDNRKLQATLVFSTMLGIIVVSDIDDTIKITQVRDRNATLRNTFLEPFSSLCPECRMFIVDGPRNPARSFAMCRPVRAALLTVSRFYTFKPISAGVFLSEIVPLEDESSSSICLKGRKKYKPTVIEPLMKQFPNRRFVFVGDSGERDPEIYGKLARDTRSRGGKSDP